MRPDSDITGVVLAGGRATRMGGEDKGLIQLNGAPMVVHVIARVRPQVHTLLVNANRNEELYRKLSSYRVVPDTLGDFAGPLAGMASAMEAAETPLILTVPCDSPLICPDLAMRLKAAMRRGGADIAVAHDGDRLQPVFALLRCALLPALVTGLKGGEHKIDRWYATQKMVTADFSDVPETFLNINTPREHDALEKRMRVLDDDGTE